MKIRSIFSNPNFSSLRRSDRAKILNDTIKEMNKLPLFKIEEEFSEMFLTEPCKFCEVMKFIVVPMFLTFMTMWFLTLAILNFFDVNLFDNLPQVLLPVVVVFSLWTYFITLKIPNTNRLSKLLMGEEFVAASDYSKTPFKDKRDWASRRFFYYRRVLLEAEAEINGGTLNSRERHLRTARLAEHLQSLAQKSKGGLSKFTNGYISSLISDDRLHFSSETSVVGYFITPEYFQDNGRNNAFDQIVLERLKMIYYDFDDPDLDRRTDLKKKLVTYHEDIENLRKCCNYLKECYRNFIDNFTLPGGVRTLIAERVQMVDEIREWATRVDNKLSFFERNIINKSTYQVNDNLKKSLKNNNPL